MPVEQPLLETRRLRLRPYEDADFPAIRDMWGDAAFTRFVGGKPLDEEAVWAKFLRMLGLWRVRDFGYWALEDRETGRLAGEAGFGDFKRAIEPALGAAPEAGWAIAPWAAGRGYASEAVAELLAWRDRSLPGDETVCIIEPDHKASLRIAAKNGFNVHCEAQYHGGAILILKRILATA